MSYGEYHIKNLIAKRCGDKGVSIGEKSTVKIENLLTETTSVGLASKDSSSTYLDKVNIYNSEICLSAYNKKKEFNSSFIIVEQLNCKNYIKKLEADTNSYISVNNYES